jgi:hypothetical protein
MKVKTDYDHELSSEDRLMQELQRMMGKKLAETGRSVYMIASSGPDKPITIVAEGTPVDIAELLIPMLVQLPKPLIMKIVEILAAGILFREGDDESVH